MTFAKKVISGNAMFMSQQEALQLFLMKQIKGRTNKCIGSIYHSTRNIYMLEDEMT